MEKTNRGFDALYRYHNVPKKEHLKNALESFKCALDSEQCAFDPACRATALFNLATSEFIKCQAHGTYCELNTPIELYEEALQSRHSGHPDRPATLLLLAQALLSRYGQQYDEANVARIMRLLAEIHPDDSRNRQTADAILRTCRFYRAMNSRNPAGIDELFRDLDRGAYIPPYGYFDRPRMLHKLGVAFWTRFQRYTNLGDLDKSIVLNEEALRLIPDGHHDWASTVECLGSSYLRRIEARGDLVDLDMSADLVQLGESVVTALDNISSIEGAGELREQIALMSAADIALQHIVHEAPSPCIPEAQSLIDEWNEEDGIPTRCRKQLGVLLSFLEGEGESKMRELLANMDWPFKEYKTKETMQILRDDYMPYFHGAFATKLRCLIDGWA